MRIIDKIYEKGEDLPVKQADLRLFVASRLNLCLKNLGIEPIFDEGDNPVGKWFYGETVGYTSNDFFAGTGKEYKRNWSETDFTW
jgi:ribonucleotide reductase beta subunit family protein with ferritin-like domain